MVAAAPLSDLHASLGEISRAYDAARLNEIINDPSVFPWVSGGAEGAIDLTEIVAHPANFLLMGEHGGVLFVHQQAGIYEAHTQVLPAGRGDWTLRIVRAALHWMFTRTDAVEILTRCPHGNRPALALAKRIGGVFEFTNHAGWIMDGKPVPADIYALRIQDWMKTAPGLAERGHWFHERLEAEYARHGYAEPPHPDDETHDRYVGAACEMMQARMPGKASVFYNRWAVMAGYEPVTVVSTDPLSIDIRDAILIVRADGDFWMPVCRLGGADTKAGSQSAQTARS